jgi:hypothetical protein
MGVGYIRCFLHCPNLHAIPLPRPSLLETIDSPQLRAKENRKVIVVCPYCGLGSAYFARDVREQMVLDKPSLFEAGECLFVSVEVGCDGESCEAPKVIHTVQGVATGTWRPTAVPRD